MARLRLIDTKRQHRDDAQPEAASAVSEFGHEVPRPKTMAVSLWTRIVRALRARHQPQGPKL